MALLLLAGSVLGAGLLLTLGSISRRAAEPERQAPIAPSASLDDGPQRSALASVPAPEHAAPPPVRAGVAAQASARGRRLLGRVVDAASGAPLPGAAIEMLQAPADGGLAPSRATTSDEQGGFAFDGVDERELQLLARAHGHQPFAEEHARPARELTIALRPLTGSLAGLVQAAEGYPLAGATILVEGGDPPASWTSVTDAAGAFALERLPDSELSVRASAPGRETVARRLLAAEPGARRTLALELCAGRTLARIEIVTLDGRPIEGARILCGEPGPRDVPTVELARTDRAGRAELAGLPARACAVWARAQGFLDGHSILAQAEAAARELEPVRLVLQARGRAIGRLTDAHGAALRGRLLFRRSAWPAAQWQHVEGAWEPRSAWSDAEGRFDVAELVPSTPYRLVLDAPGHAPTPVAGDVMVLPGDVLDLGALRLAAGRSLEGRVLVPPGAEASAVRLGAIGVLDGAPMTWREASVAEDGRFELRAMPRAAFTVRARSGEIERDVSVSAEQASIVVDLREPVGSWTLSVRCVDLLGRPVAGVPLVARAPEAAHRPLVPASEPGLYELPDASGPLVVVALAAESGFLQLDADARLGPSERSAELCVEAAARLTGRVVESAGGRAVRGAEVRWRCAELDPRRSRPGAEARVRVDADGAYELQVPAAWPGLLFAGAPGFVGDSADLPPLGQAGGQHVFALARAGRLIAEARADSGEPLAGALVRCFAPADEPTGTASPIELATDALGRAVFDVERSGSHRVELCWGSVQEERTLDVAPGEEVRVAFAPVPAAVDVRVRVWDPAGTPAVARPVVLADRQRLFSARTGADGIARFAALPPGDYRLRVQRPEGAGQQSLSVSIPTDTRPFDLELRLE